jgi:cobalt-zinc-cadmium efflux system membrane fusion protein
MKRNALVLLAVVAIGAACQGNSESQDSVGMPGMSQDSDSSSAKAVVTFTAAQIAHGKVRWEPATLAAIAASVEAAGQVVPNEDRTARLAAPAQSRVLSVHVSPGERVTEGHGLVTLQSQEATMAHSDVAKATAELSSRRAAATYARSARDRAARLLELKAIPRQEYEQAVADDELALAQVTQAEAELQRARSTASQLGVNLTDGSMVLRSPIAGVVMTRDVVPGSVVGAGELLITITDPSSLWLTVALPEALAGAISANSTLRFAVAAYPADTFTARVQSISATLDPQTRSLPVRGLFVNTGGRLRPGMFARVWVQSAVQQMVTTVPDSAIQRLQGRNVVFVAHPNDEGGARFESRDVDIGDSRNGRTAILAGLATGEAIVVQGAFAVKSELTKPQTPMEM